MTEKTGSDFVFSNWQVIAKFSYENFLRFGHGAVIFFDKENKRDSLGYVLTNNLFSALDSGNLIDSDGQLLAHVKSYVWDSTRDPDDPLMPKDMPRIRKIERQILDKFLVGHDPDYDVLYIYLTGETARIGICGSMNCPARLYNIEQTPEINYFPKELMSGDLNDNYEITYRHCSQHLQSMDEPVLAHPQNESKEVYRFLWLRSFFQPIAIRVEKNKSAFSIVTKETEGVGGHYPKKLSRQTDNTLNHEQWKQIALFIEKSHFWQMPQHRENLVLDGADWVLEGFRNKKYFAVFRCSPTTDGLDKDFREVCLHLLSLTDIEIPIKEIY